MSVFGLESENVRGVWRIDTNEKLRNLNYSPNIIRMIQSRRIRRAEHVTSKGKRETNTKFW
jgi:hypothetical protein